MAERLDARVEEVEFDPAFRAWVNAAFERKISRTTISRACSMGLEATCECIIDGSPHSVRALLESYELILRDGVRRTILLETMTNVCVIGGRLKFVAGAQTVELELGVESAQKWLTKISTPPPSLALKLGIHDAVKVYLIAGDACAELTSAVTGHITKRIAEADMICAVATDPKQLQKVLSTASSREPCPVWVIYPKGKNSTLSEGSVREAMRAAGYVDTKVSAVSNQLSAARYNPRKS